SGRANSHGKEPSMRYGYLALAAALAISGCSSGAPAAPSKPAEPEKPKMTPAAKPVEAPKPPPAPVIDRTPIKADVSKIKFLSESSELFSYDDGESRAFFYTNGTGELTVKVPADGEYEVVVTASCTAAK